MSLTEINAELKLLKVAVRIEIQGGKLYLRATLPPKPTSKNKSSHQQRIALGIKASDVGRHCQLK